MNRSLLFGALAVLFLVVVLAPVALLDIGIAAAIWIVFQLIAVLAFLAVATWVVASVWKAVQRR